ncbi:MAG: AbrB/MazE/SpoVT family DNA-binding domain-containing protein [Actinomycetota bacterium]|jgi:bifunctional DNA-binding transcriptional regulator/antitoxin component of YhaV-PrlF toxin-antitoxin module|nr:AbrB/MazE/SpoVT family DNA-binding domain-containing protein [Rubrobacter sp.]MDQ3508836.1 AbrB/MazE/SpoVT family DNA-binding domain-containing protein [Actinomycetota bacterium]
MSERVEVVLDDEGRLVVPEALRRRLGLVSGATLVVERETDEATYLRIYAPEEARIVDKDGVMVIRASGDVLVDDVARAERDRRVAELLGRG